MATKQLKQSSSRCILPGFEPSLKEGLGFMPASRNPLAGTRPSGDDFIHIVPPVMTIRTRDSGYAAILTALWLQTLASE